MNKQCSTSPTIFLKIQTRVFQFLNIFESFKQKVSHNFRNKYNFDKDLGSSIEKNEKDGLKKFHCNFGDLRTINY